MNRAQLNAGIQRGQAKAWHRVFDLCYRLGMNIDNYPTRPVEGFIRELARRDKSPERIRQQKHNKKHLEQKRQAGAAWRAMTPEERKQDLRVARRNLERILNRDN